MVHTWSLMQGLADTDVSATEIYGANAKKLQELKNKYDPDNLFDRGTRLVPRPVVVVY
jgi:FAD/FMN-containing dehydrogenase